MFDSIGSLKKIRKIYAGGTDILSISQITMSCMNMTTFTRGLDRKTVDECAVLFNKYKSDTEKKQFDKQSLEATTLSIIRSFQEIKYSEYSDYLLYDIYQYSEKIAEWLDDGEDDMVINRKAISLYAVMSTLLYMYPCIGIEIDYDKPAKVLDAILTERMVDPEAVKYVLKMYAMCAGDVVNTSAQMKKEAEKNKPVECFEIRELIGTLVFLKYNFSEKFRVITESIQDLTGKYDLLNAAIFIYTNPNDNDYVQGLTDSIIKVYFSDSNKFTICTDANRCYNIGSSYFAGQGVEKDYTKAFEYFQRAAALGDKESMAVIGDFYYTRAAEVGFKMDPIKAVEWYEKAKTPVALLNLGYMYEYGDGVDIDYEKAMDYYLLAADSEVTEAYGNIGTMYLEGEGVEQDTETAIEWYKKAANKGDLDSIIQIGKIYFYGWDIEEDHVKALPWFLEAAEADSDEGKYLTMMTYFFASKSDSSALEEALFWGKQLVETGYEKEGTPYSIKELVGIIEQEIRDRDLNNDIEDDDIAKEDDFEDISGEYLYEESYVWFKDDGSTSDAFDVGLDCTIELNDEFDCIVTVNENQYEGVWDYSDEEHIDISGFENLDIAIVRGFSDYLVSYFGNQISVYENDRQNEDSGFKHIFIKDE